jgi:coenzyme F420-0:L-glutamate ligase/coenzyme F420-1:gamma-L-glutamate ligase
MRSPLTLTPLEGLPLIEPGDNLADLILENCAGMDLTIQDGDIFMLAQKIVSKAEGRLINLGSVQPSARAVELAEFTDKDPRVVELVLQESRQVLRTRPGLMVVEHRLGFVCANAGIDHSNVQGQWGNAEEWVLLLPEDPDQSARTIAQSLSSATGREIGVAIIDSHGRAWRLGVVGVCIGLAGVPGLVDLRGESDLFGYDLRVTQVGAADELAAAASLAMGQAAEGIPVVHVRGFPYPLRPAALAELLRPRDQDLFR